MSNSMVVPGSFRDPAGFLFRADGTLYRQINEAYRDDYEHLLSSGLYDALTEQGALIEHADADLSLARDSRAYRVIRPEVVSFVSYPYEWCFSQLRDAALLTLEIQKRALEHGMSLRDASAYNIQFHRGRPVLVDTLSFEQLREGEPWVAYRQFCQHFLAPLALMAYRDPSLGRLSQIHIDGVPLGLARTLLPRRTRLRFGLFVHLHAHAKQLARHQGTPARSKTSGKRFTTTAFRGLIESLEKAVRRLRWKGEQSVWSEYYRQAEHYSPEALERKEQVVKGFVEETSPECVWDLGGNIGVFARAAAATGARVVCFDSDHACVDANYCKSRRDGEERILPLVCDLTNPTPAIGWEGRERMSLTERGPADLVLALALVHHLAIGNNVPLDRIASFFAELCSGLVVEFVPKADPKVSQLLATREDIFPDYTQAGFEAAFERFFRTDRVEQLPGSERRLYLMRRRGAT